MIALPLILLVATTGKPPEAPPQAPVVHIIQAKPAKPKAKCAHGKCAGNSGAVPVGTKAPVGTTHPVGTPG
ncbi:MAG: hypothetical protein JO290_10250 [Sphingomonadaceae bacterium]|nr:hypothetical protein [Sphingomonadaceae bacterium]